MTLDQLEIFTTVAREGGLRMASKVLNKSQPAVSISMKNLEDELKVTLLDRNSYRVSLTKEGETLCSKANEILSHINQFDVLANELSMGIEPKLLIAIDYLCPLDFLLQVLNNFSNKRTRTKLEMDFEILGGSEEKLLQGDANMAITPFISKHAKVTFKKIYEVEVIPVGLKSIFKTNKPAIDFFLSLPQIAVKDSSKKSKPLDFGGHPDTNKWIVSDHMIKKQLILSGFGWGHLEKASIEKELKSSKLIELKVNGLQNKKMPLYLVRSNEKPFGPIANDLWDFICERFNKK